MLALILALIAVVLWAALVYFGEKAPLVIYSLPFLAAAVVAYFVMFISASVANMRWVVPQVHFTMKR